MTAFDTVDHALLLYRLKKVGLSVDALDWFHNYLSDRPQCVAQEGMKSEFQRITKGVPQGSILGPIVFTLYINYIGKIVDSANLHLYADDTMIYSSASNIENAFQDLQLVFDVIQKQLFQLKLVLNARKTTFMVFSVLKVNRWSHLPILTITDQQIDRVTYKYLGIWLDENLNLKWHIDNLTKKLKLKWGFYDGTTPFVSLFFTDQISQSI